MVNRKIEGKAGEGLVPGTVEFSPSEVMARGPKSLIENLTEATAQITLREETENFVRTVSLNALDDQGEVVKDIELIPSETEAKVSIVKASNNKTVGIKVTTTGSPKSGYYISSIAVTPEVLDITGVRSLIADINSVGTTEIDVSGLNNSLEKDVNISLPNGVALQAGSPSSVKVKISFSATDSSREVNLTPSFVNLDDSTLKVSSVAPAQLKAIISGPVDQLNSIKSSDISLPLDLKGKGPGIYNFDILLAAAKAPDGLVVQSILPSAVSVSIEKK